MFLFPSLGGKKIGKSGSIDFQVVLGYNKGAAKKAGPVSIKRDYTGGTEMNYATAKATAAIQGRHWKSPDARGRWQTNARVRGSLQTYSGPSKKTLGKRAARANRKRR